MFRLFGRKKHQTLESLLAEGVIHKNVFALITKVKNLRKLGRETEAAESVKEAVVLAARHAENVKGTYKPLALLSFVYLECGEYGTAASILERILKPGAFLIPEKETVILQGALQKAQRELIATSRKPVSTTSNFTQVYSCQNCGRLYNYVTMPCPNCAWYAPDREALAKSFVLSNNYIKIPALLILAREVAQERNPFEIVVNATQNADDYLSMPEEESRLSFLLDLLHQNAKRNHRDLNEVRRCPTCGGRVVMSQERKCGSCNADIDWPNSIRALVCMDNLLWLFERRIEVDDRLEFSAFVCLLVAMLNDLLRKQELPSKERRAYAVHLITALGSVSDLKRGAVIDMRNLDKLEIYIVKDDALDDSQTFGLFIHSEFESFLSLVKHGIGL